MTRIFGELVTASAAQFPVESARQKWFKLAPYGEKSAVMASGHQFTIEGPGPIKLPADPTAVLVNDEHDRTRETGHVDQLVEQADGLYGRVAFAPGPAGDKALDDIATGRRTGVSVELENPVIRAGKLLRGFLSNVGHVAKPSFSGATVLAAAADTGDLDAELAAAMAAIQSVRDQLVDGNGDQTDQTDQTETTDKDPNVGATATASTLPGTPAPAPSASVLAAALTGAGPAAPADPAPPAVSPLVVLASAAAQLVKAAAGMASETVRAAALDTVMQADVFDAVSVPAYVGELWKGRRYQGRYLDLVDTAPLTSQSVIGWRWVEGKTPQVARWTPGTGATMADIPTNEVKAESKTYNAFRIAGGHAVDRIHVDLPNAEWWESYNLESTDDYARKLDAEIVAHITDPANTTNLELSAGATHRDRIMEGIGAAIEFADPNWMLVGWDVFRYLADEKLLDQQAVRTGDFTREGPVLSSSFLGIPVKSAPRSLVDQNGRILIGAKPANVLHELPGGPVRVDTQEIQKATVQHGVFGYHILRPTDTRGVIDVTVAAA